MISAILLTLAMAFASTAEDLTLKSQLGELASCQTAMNLEHDHDPYMSQHQGLLIHFEESESGHSLQTTFSDGTHLFRVNVPYSRDRHETNFRLEVPFPGGSRSYCVTYESRQSQGLEDMIKRFEKTPPAACPTLAAQSAQLLSESSAESALSDLKRGMSADLAWRMKHAKKMEVAKGRPQPFAKKLFDRMLHIPVSNCAILKDQAAGEKVLREITALQSGTPGGASKAKGARGQD